MEARRRTVERERERELHFEVCVDVRTNWFAFWKKKILVR